MKKIFTFVICMFFAIGGLFAQKLSYQAVVRNSANELVYDASVTVVLSILDANGAVQYSETQTAVTNQNGLLSLIVGEATNATGSMVGVNWNDASIKTVITLPSGEVITNVMPVTAVPYALFADNTGGSINQVQSNWMETNQDSRAYILNKPTIPSVPTNVSAFQNDAGYLTRDSIAALQQTITLLVDMVASLNMRMTQEQFTATAGQTVFNLQHAAKTDCVVRCYVNGVMVGGNHNGVLELNANNAQQVVYDAASNRNYVLKANDRVTIVYWY